MKLFTSEQVSAGHPDKIADQISDALLDQYLLQDPNSRCAIEVGIKDNTVFLFGEVSSSAEVDAAPIVQGILQRRTAPWGKHYNSPVEVIDRLGRQSNDIALGVDTGGAGDQGIMVGYAEAGTESMLPLPYLLATRVLQELDKADFDFLGPDRKAQVSMRSDGTIDTLLLSTQHAEEVDRSDVYAAVDLAWNLAFSSLGISSGAEGARKLVNPTGMFVTGGPEGDAGLTGRKIIADTYGSLSSHGGGAFSGKDATKVDRSAAYQARHAAKRLVSAGLATKAEVRVAYAIGVKEPLQVGISGDILDLELAKELVREEYDWSPAGIIERFHLRKPIFEATSTYGHFTDPTAPWELV